MSLRALEDGVFQLYDLKVVVVVPDGSIGDITKDTPLPCNSHIGEYFELHGELLFLPPGQGMSIYSIGSLV